MCDQIHLKTCAAECCVLNSSTHQETIPDEVIRGIRIFDINFLGGLLIILIYTHHHSQTQNIFYLVIEGYFVYMPILEFLMTYFPRAAFQGLVE